MLFEGLVIGDGRRHVCECHDSSDEMEMRTEQKSFVIVE